MLFLSATFWCGLRWEKDFDNTRGDKWLLHQFKYYIKILKWSLFNLEEDGIICLNLGLPILLRIF